MKHLKKARLPVALALMGLASVMWAWRLGRHEGLQLQVSGDLLYQKAITEWQDPDGKKVVVYLSTGSTGYAFWLELNPEYRHYSYQTKLFTCQNFDPESVKVAMDRAREWAARDIEGGDTRIRDRKYLRPQADPDLVAVDQAGFVATPDRLIQDAIVKAEHLELLELRDTVNRLALERDLLKAKLEAKEGLR